MKIQDIIFLVILIAFLYKAKPNWFVGAGLVSFLISIPLFALHIFFTAERLVWYAAGFLFVAVIVNLYQMMRDK